MMALVALLALGFFLWRGAGVVALALLGAGAAWSVFLTMRVGRASLGGVGGHAEWVRDVAFRPRLAAAPSWAAAAGLVAAGVALGLCGG